MSTKETDHEDEKSAQEYVSLITKHQNALRRFIISLMPGSPDVDDVLQEANIVLWEKRKQFKPGSNFVAWGTTIAKFQVMSFRSKAVRSQEICFSDEFVHELAEKLAPDAPEGPLLASLDSCLDKLGEKPRELLFVRYTRGKSLKDYAVEKGTSAEVMRVTLHRIRKMLKICIEDSLKGQSI